MNVQSLKEIASDAVEYAAFAVVTMAAWCLFAFVLLIIVIGVAVLFGADVTPSKSHREAFMTECMTDHKRYECEVLWQRAQQRDSDPVIVPMPIVVPR